MIDLHVHSTFSVDSFLEIKDIFRLRSKRNLKFLGISDHLDFDPRDQSYKKYDFKIINKAVSFYKESIPEAEEHIFIGAEITFQKKFLNKIKNFIETTPVDYTIGSIHYVEDVLISKWVIENEQKGFNKYFDALSELVSSGLFNIVGHFDYFKKYLSTGDYYDENKYITQIRDIFKLMIKKDISLEVNTSGWKYFISSSFPSLEMVKLYKEEGGKLITVGSDAHKWYELGYRIKEVVNFLKDIGYKEIVFFDKKEIKFSPL